MKRQMEMLLSVKLVFLVLCLAGSAMGAVSYSSDQQAPEEADVRRGSPMLGCKELRSKRYISDGHCTSARPLLEVVCAGACLPLDQLPWYSDGSPAATAASWSCEPGAVRLRRVHLLCPDGERKSYRVPVVRACKCVRNLEHATHGS